MYLVEVLWRTLLCVIRLRWPYFICMYFVSSKCCPFFPCGTNTAQSAQITMTPFQLMRLMRTSPISRAWLVCRTWATHATWMPSYSVSAASHRWWNTFSLESTLPLFKSKTICHPCSRSLTPALQGEVRGGTLWSPYEGLNQLGEAAVPQIPFLGWVKWEGQPRNEWSFVWGLMPHA